MIALIDEYAVKVLKKLKDGGARFGELRQVVRNPRTLSKRLKMLKSEGLVLCEKGFYCFRIRVSVLHVFWKTLSPFCLLASLENVEKLPFIYADFLSKYCEILCEIA